MEVLHEILNRDCALFVPPDDIQNWINAINYTKDKNARYCMGNSAYNLFKNKFTWNKRVQHIFYDKINNEYYNAN